MQAPGWVAIIDDDRSICVALARLLRCHGIRVQAFDSTAEYLRASEAAEPSCILLDVHLRGGKTCMEVLDRIEAAGTGPSVLLMSGADEAPAALGDWLSSGTEFLRKPFDPTLLLERVLSYLQREEVSA